MFGITRIKQMKDNLALMVGSAFPPEKAFDIEKKELEEAEAEKFYQDIIALDVLPTTSRNDEGKVEASHSLGSSTPSLPLTETSFGLTADNAISESKLMTVKEHE